MKFARSLLKVLFLVRCVSLFAVAVMIAIVVQDAPFTKAAYRKVDRDRTAVHRDEILSRSMTRYAVAVAVYFIVPTKIKSSMYW